MRKVALVCFLLGVLTSCGSKKKVVVTQTVKKEQKRTAPIRTVQREMRVVESTPKVTEEIRTMEAPQPAAKLTYADKIRNYIAEFEEVAKVEMEAYGIPASITLAQGILESGAGYGDLTKRSKNHFGIKCHGWKGKKVYHDDDLLQECFRKYDDAGRSFRDHSIFLTTRKRYAGLFKLRKTDYKGWARGLKAAGYATDPKYPNKLISIVEKYNLDKYDREVLGMETTTPEQPEPKPRKEVVQVQTENPGDGYQVQKGDTLYSISRRYSLSVSELKALNNLNDNTIKIGQVLRIASAPVTKTSTTETDEFDF